MHDIWQTLSELRQPCLARATPVAALDDRGMVRDSVLKSIDETLWEDIESSLQEASIPHFQDEHLYTSDKWLTTSALQKCIRRGHSDLAERYVRSGIRIDADHTFRRLAVIALEDVGLGDLKLVAATLAVLSDKRRRQNIGEERLAVDLVTRMSRAVKSRLACEMLSLVEYDPNSAKIAEPLYALDAAALSQIVRHEGIGSTEHLISLWLLHGTDRLRSRQISSISGAGQRGLLELMTKQSAPLIFPYIVRMGLSRCRDSLAIPYVALAKFAHRNPFLQTRPNNIPLPEFIGSYPSFAYDMHTRIGRRAIRDFEVNCTGELRSAGVQNAGNLVFALEGGLLDDRVTGGGADQISKTAMMLELFGEDRPCSSICDLRDGIFSNFRGIRRQVAASV